MNRLGDVTCYTVTLEWRNGDGDYEWYEARLTSEGNALLLRDMQDTRKPSIILARRESLSEGQPNEWVAVVKKALISCCSRRESPEEFAERKESARVMFENQQNMSQFWMSRASDKK